MFFIIPIEMIIFIKETIEEFKLDFENCVPKFCPKISFLKLEITKEVPRI